MRFAVRMEERERGEERGVMGFLRKCDGEVQKVVKMDWGGTTRYIWRRITTYFMVRLGRRNKELNEFLGGEGLGRRMTTNFIIGLRRHNNELNELTNFLAARKGAKHCSSLCSQSEGDGYVANLSEIYCGLCGAAAPVRGSYSRIGARPYLPPQLIDSRCCPCKGRISWAGLAPQQDSRYEPLTGARFINQPQEVGGKPLP